jgi:hypothetical protein
MGDGVDGRNFSHAILMRRLVFGVEKSEVELSDSAGRGKSFKLEVPFVFLLCFFCVPSTRIY